MDPKQIILLIPILLVLGVFVLVADDDKVGYQSTLEEPLSHWKFEENIGATTFDDNQGTNNLGCTNCPTAGINGKVGKALDFDGINDILTVADNPTLDLPVYTAAAWVNVDDFDGINDQTVMRKGTVNYLIRLNETGELSCQTRVSGVVQVIGSDELLQEDTFYHLICSYDGSWLKAYINGELVDSKLVGGNSDVNTGVFSVGAFSTGPSVFFNGIIDEPMLFDYALSSSEAQLLYQHGLDYEVIIPADYSDYGRALVPIVICLGLILTLFAMTKEE